MLLYILFAIVKSRNKEYRSFSFTGINRKQVKLTDPNKYIPKNKMNIASLFQKENDHGNWYYVHFLNKNYINISTSVDIQSDNGLIKNTFVLYLTSRQLEKLANISLVKQIEPYEKYFCEDKNNENSDQLLVITTSDFELPENKEYYEIEKKNSKNSFIVKIVRKNMKDYQFRRFKQKVIDHLSQIPEVQKITDYKIPVVNNALMAGFTQKNSYDFKLPKGENFYYLERYLNDNGITGENQIITILDTPIDFQHAMFRDDEVTVEINRSLPNHRKLVYYGFGGNMKDLEREMDVNEHGTHVAGTAAGNSMCENDDERGVSYFNGIAPDAKILYAGHFNNVSSNELGKLMKIYNSKISSNSWGTVTFYNPENYMFGKLADENHDITLIFSAGNEHLKGNFTVGDPGGSKNVVTVGSVGDFYGDIIYNMQSNDDPESYITAYGYLVNDPWFEGIIGSHLETSDIVYIDLDKGKKCELIKDNKAIVYGNNISWVNECNLSMSTGIFWTVDKSRAQQFIAKTRSLTGSRSFLMNSTKKITQTWYSSTGPANKGILKPDIMAPGTSIISAKSRKHSTSPHGCREENEGDFTFMDGTSMACPNIAGAAALIHQYFHSGQWGEEVVLDGATTRALLINSARHPHNSKVPDIVFGHGVVDLSTIIPIEDDFGVQITHQDQAQKASVTENGHVISTISVDKSKNKKLQITLSYIDTMLNMDSPLPLTRDLDLIVISPSRKTYIGDHLPNSDTQHLSTNEKVIINENEPEDGEYTIHVYGSRFVDNQVPGMTTKQDFAVVASGPIENGFLSFKDSYDCPCDQCDSRHPGRCLCNEGYQNGHMCQVGVTTVNGEKVQITLEPLEIKRIRFISTKKIKYVYSKSENPGIGSSVWVSTKCNTALGEYDATTYIENDFTGVEVNYGTKEICVAIFNNNDMKSTFTIEARNKAMINWLFVNLIIVAVIFVIVVIALICICCSCCKGKKCCCKREEKIFETTSEPLSQYLLESPK